MENRHLCIVLCIPWYFFHGHEGRTEVKSEKNKISFLQLLRFYQLIRDTYKSLFDQDPNCLSAPDMSTPTSIENFVAS